MTVEQRIEDPVDQFPIGMRVLAVDDDPTCLKLLETLLRRCQYHVTTTSQARTALNMLRENKDKFDLVISDVHMPDMDGFKLLELVGLEMDLPVIMLSANGDRKLVMKGISHGACDYLLKPVRIEELKNIWQHVIRRKKFDPKSQNSSGNQDAAYNGGDGDPGAAGAGSLDRNGKVTKKQRKDQDDDGDDDHDDNGDDNNDDPSSQKKQRVVWSVDLHRKFVAAVNQLGIEKAVPKKILDLMNVDKLTRENVASHLQKYRLYLKRISCVANQQASMVAAFGTTDTSYLRMNSMNGHGSFNPLAMSMQFQNQSFRPFPPGGMISRLNSPANLGLRLPSSGGMVQMGNNAPNPTNPNEHLKFHDQTLLQGMSVPFELDKGVSHIGDLSATVDDSTVFTSLSDSKLSSNGIGISNNMLMLGQHGHNPQSGRDFMNQSLKSEFCSPSDNWSNPDHSQSTGFQPNSFPLTDRFKQTGLSSSGSRDGIMARIAGNQFDGSSMSSVAIQSHISAADTQCQVSGIGNSSSLVPSWDNKQDSGYRANPNLLMPVNGVMSTIDHSLEMKNTMFHRDMDFNYTMGQPSYGDPSMLRYDDIEKSTMEAKLRQQEYIMSHQQRPQGSYIMSHFGSMGDYVSGSVKQEHNKAEGDYNPFGNGNMV